MVRFVRPEPPIELSEPFISHLLSHRQEATDRSTRIELTEQTPRGKLCVMSRQVIMDLPEGTFSALRSDPAELARELRLAAAVKWYELGRLSQAKAAELAGLSRYDFIHALARFEVSPFQETVEEVAEGLAREQ